MLKKRKNNSDLTRKTQRNFTLSTNASLDAKVNEYINWYYENMVKGKYTKIGEYWAPIQLRNLIEKMAVWYELRYPDYEINRIMPGSGQEHTNINDVMFNCNNYINEKTPENSDIRNLQWSEFYNTEAFINSLPWEERYIFSEPRYRWIVHLNPNDLDECLYLNSKGIITESKGIEKYSKSIIKDEELIGKHVINVAKLLDEKGIKLPQNNELEQIIQHVELHVYQKEGLLDCVMYRIIERGGNRMGPRRAFLFAKEFKRNIDIPMMYAVDYSDPGLRRFVNEYIKAGGSTDLICYEGYFSKLKKDIFLPTVSVQELLRTIPHDCINKYTPEETELHQNLVNVLSSELDNEIKLTLQNNKR